MDQDLKTLTQELGMLIEEIGKTLKYDTPPTYEDLTHLRDATSCCTKTIQTIRDTFYT